MSEMLKNKTRTKKVKSKKKQKNNREDSKYKIDK